MATATKTPSGKWRVLVYCGTVNGKKKRKSFTGRTKKEAEFLANQYLMELEKPKKSNYEYRDWTLNQVLRGYLEVSKNLLSPSTVTGYESLLRRYKEKIPTYLEMKMEKLSDQAMQEIIGIFAEKLSAKTVANMFTFISSACKYYGFQYTVKLPKKSETVVAIPTEEQIIALTESTKGTDMEIPFLLGAFCMMRRAEICALQMSDIDFKNNTINIHRNLVQNSDRTWSVVETTKNHTNRLVVAPSYVIQRIKEIGYITHLSPDKISKHHRVLLKRNGVPHFKFHALRHYSASIRHALNIPDQFIQEAGGWKSDRVLKQVYRHTLSDYEKKMQDIANSHFDDVINKKNEHQEDMKSVQ